MVDKAGKIILVTGATGRQGGATARHLLTNGWQVKALTRDASKPEAQALAQAGAEIVQGDLEDKAALLDLMQGVYGVYSVQAAPPDSISAPRPRWNPIIKVPTTGTRPFIPRQTLPASSMPTKQGPTLFGNPVSARSCLM